MNDLISRQAAIDVADAVWSVTGDKNVAKVWDQIRNLPSAQQPEICETCKHGYFGDTQCDNCCVRYPSHYERRTDG